MNNKQTFHAFYCFSDSLYFLRVSLICTVLVELIILLFASHNFFLPLMFYLNHAYSTALFHTPTTPIGFTKISFTTTSQLHHHIPRSVLNPRNPRHAIPPSGKQKVFFWLLGKSKRSAVAAKSTLQTAITASSEHQSDMVSTSLFQSNANSVNQLDPEHDGADLLSLIHI